MNIICICFLHLFLVSSSIQEDKNELFIKFLEKNLFKLNSVPESFDPKILLSKWCKIAKKSRYSRLAVMKPYLNIIISHDQKIFNEFCIFHIKNDYTKILNLVDDRSSLSNLVCGYYLGLTDGSDFPIKVLKYLSDSEKFKLFYPLYSRNSIKTQNIIIFLKSFKSNDVLREIFSQLTPIELVNLCSQENLPLTPRKFQDHEFTDQEVLILDSEANLEFLFIIVGPLRFESHLRRLIQLKGDKYRSWISSMTRGIVKYSILRTAYELKLSLNPIGQFLNNNFEKNLSIDYVEDNFDVIAEDGKNMELYGFLKYILTKNYNFMMNWKLLSKMVLLLGPELFEKHFIQYLKNCTLNPANRLSLNVNITESKTVEYIFRLFINMNYELLAGLLKQNDSNSIIIYANIIISNIIYKLRNLKTFFTDGLYRIPFGVFTNEEKIVLDLYRNGELEKISIELVAPIISFKIGAPKKFCEIYRL